MARIRTRLLVGLTICLAAAGCDAAPLAPATSPIATSPAPSLRPSPSPSIPPAVDPLEVTDAEQVLVEPFSGTGKGRTPEFRVPDREYLVRVICTGGGSVRVSADGDRADAGVDMPCDGTLGRTRVITDDERARVLIDPTGSARWSVVVVVSNGLSPT